MQGKKIDIGKKGESIVINYYKKLGFKLVKKNYTIKGGELDLILEKDNLMVFVEVKVINNISDLSGYITKKKLNFVKKTIKSFLLNYNIDKDYRLDAVFVKNNSIFELFENIEI